jgi:hypothetical protein
VRVGVGFLILTFPGIWCFWFFRGCAGPIASLLGSRSRNPRCLCPSAHLPYWVLSFCAAGLQGVLQLPVTQVYDSGPFSGPSASGMDPQSPILDRENVPFPPTHVNQIVLSSPSVTIFGSEYSHTCLPPFWFQTLSIQSKSRLPRAHRGTFTHQVAFQEEAPKPCNPPRGLCRPGEFPELQCVANQR